MSALLAVEMRRALARRLVRVLAGLALLGVALAALVTFLRTEPAGEGAARARLEAERGRFVADCIREAEEFGVVPGPGEGRIPRGLIEERCRQIATSDLFFEEPGFHLRDLDDVARNVTVPFTLLAWVLGATLIGAEWRAGTVTTLLTWEPRRVRVMAAKATAAVVLGGGLALLLYAVLLSGLLPTALLKGDAAGAGAPFARELVGVVFRSVALAAMAGAIGFALGAIGRNTALALGAGFVYLAILEGGLLGGVFPGIRQWLIVGNSLVFVTGESFDVAGRSVAEAGVILAAYALGAVAIATAAFRARDVT